MKYIGGLPAQNRSSCEGEAIDEGRDHGGWGEQE